MTGKSNCKPLHPPSGTPCTKFYRYFHRSRDVEKCLDPSLSWSAQNFDDWHTNWQTDGQNRLLNPASRMRARGNKVSIAHKESWKLPSCAKKWITIKTATTPQVHVQSQPQGSNRSQGSHRGQQQLRSVLHTHRQTWQLHTVNEELGVWEWAEHYINTC